MTRLTEQETKSAHSSTKGTNFIGDFKINRLRIFTPQRDRGSFIEFGDGTQFCMFKHPNDHLFKSHMYSYLLMLNVMLTLPSIMT